jgi:hypothetical protein
MANYDDEYKYPKDEYVAENVNDIESADEIAARALEDEAVQEGESANVAPAPSLVAKLGGFWQELPQSGKRSIVIVSSILGLVIVAAVWGSVSNAHGKKQSAQHATAVQPALVQAQATPALSADQNMLQQSLQEQADAAKSKAVVQQLQAQVTQMQAAMTSTMQSNVALKNQVASLNSEVSATTEQNNYLKQQIVGLNESIDQLKAAAGMVKKHQADMARDKIQFIAHYTLIGMVSGRAWVKDQRGNTFSIKVGDSLKDFGIVAKIDSDAGFIESRKGQLIEYNINV